MKSKSLLDRPMLALTPVDSLYLSDLVQNVFILGSTSSGKTGTAKRHDIDR